MYFNASFYWSVSGRILEHSGELRDENWDEDQPLEPLNHCVVIEGENFKLKNIQCHSHTIEYGLCQVPFVNTIKTLYPEGSLL